MKTTISKIVLIAISFFTLQSIANAQDGKVIRVRTTPPVQRKEVDKPITNINAGQTEVSIKAKDAAINYGALLLPKQDKTLGMATGIIKVTTDSLIDFSKDGQLSFSIKLADVRENPPTPNNGGLIGFKYSFIGDFISNRTHTDKTIKYAAVTYTKLNDREYSYTVYNIPINSSFAIVFTSNFTNVYTSEEPLNYLKTSVIKNAFHWDYNTIHNKQPDPNYQAVQANYAFQLLPITIADQIMVK